ncbi:MAG: RluA family pseudouridine synthase [Bacteroidota bacterium]
MSQPVRLQAYGVNLFPGAWTKSALKKALKKNWITVNGQVASTATLIRGGERIQLTRPATTELKKKLYLDITVLYEDDYLVIIHKPAGVVVSGNTFRTVANALPQYLRPSTLTDAAQPQPVHRLDYGTTGVLLIGKTSSAIRKLNQLFEQKEIQKTYYAVTIGKMEEKGTLDGPIDGKAARSEYERCATVASARFTQLNLVKLYPQTGRRHQLRKHLARSGHPILGDKDYSQAGLVLRGKGIYLHA